MKRWVRRAPWTAGIAALTLLGGCAIGSGGSSTGTTTGGDSAGAPASAPSDRPGAPLTQFSQAVTDACAGDSPTLKAIRDRKVLQWGIGVTPPFAFKQPDGTWAGVEADNATELAALLGVKAEIQDYDYGVMTTAIQSRKADVVGAQLFITPERAKAIAFSAPYYLSGQLFYVLESSPYQTIDDLNSADVRFVYGTGNAQKAIAEKYIPKAKITDAPLRGQLLLYEFLATKQADVSMVEAAPMPVLKSKYTNPQLAAIGLKGRVTGATAGADEIIDPFEVALGLPQGDAGLKSCVDGWIAEAKSSGRMEQRIQYWLKQNAAG
jgi:ABC-type amino acid transport substrate-binding protein